MSKDQFVLALDQGTTGTTASIIGHDGLSKAKVNIEFEQHYPQPGWVEHSPGEIWKTVEDSIEQCLTKAGVSASQISTIGITNQRETVVAWSSETSESLYNAIVWQCRRTTEFTDSLKAAGHSDLISKKTGLVIDPYFSASKMRWLIKEVESVRKAASKSQLRLGTIDSFLIWQMSGGEFVTDVSNASRTQLMNIDTGEWDEELLNLFEVSNSSLPKICPSSHRMAVTKGMRSLPDGIAISGLAGDQQAALFGQACFAKGDAKCTFGTGSFILMNSGSERVDSPDGLLTTVAWQLGENQPRVYALEGGAFICGAAVQWLRDGLSLIDNAAEIEELARSVQSSEGVQMVPAFAGLGSPHWDPGARGMIMGLTRGSGRGHLARATLEAMALQNVEILKVMAKDLGESLSGLKVDGGAVANSLLMQLQADYLGAKIIKPKNIETTAAGAAFLAGLSEGVWTSLEDIQKSWVVDEAFEPEIDSESRERRMTAWQKAIQACRVMGTAED